MFLNFFNNTVMGWAYTIPVLLILVDFITGVLAAEHNKTFAWPKIALCLGNDAVKYMVSIALVLVAQLFNAPDLLIIAGSSASILVLATAVGASILENIKAMGASPVVMSEIMTLEQALLKYLPVSHDMLVRVPNPLLRDGQTVNVIPTPLPPTQPILPPTFPAA
jgi:phage-related holin